MLNGFVGGTLFIGIFLSIIFMLGTVLVITINRFLKVMRIVSVLLFFKRLGWTTFKSSKLFVSKYLPSSSSLLIFAFIHLAFAYHMLSLIVRIIGVFNPSLMLVVTIIVCGVFFLAYVLGFLPLRRVLIVESYRCNYIESSLN